tara:strand:- start:1148 stop:1597 length:450 start_codon:yes stop_codon:yes gene_type:complete
MDSLPCAVGITFILSSIIMSVLNLNKDKFNKFFNLLDPEQEKKYNEIISERITIYNIGLIIGIIMGILYYYYNKKNRDKYIFCKVLSIMSIVKLCIYYFYPKKPIMLNYLTNEEQVKSWIEVYTTMKNKWKQSMIFGFIGYLFISFSIK